ncbi:hypothetical protein FM037_07370 [Shewanella psychropiezotolerans]|uniref:Uncharacterized protein n=1 Tax=Shewanella psychropiezotolerans TaxID=2593655 RepID=A0ABX5WVG4_9GAMM|nr:hypothetical protein [Shewanella psychropiezotolerans]QDO83079.1 hypothetical protein FM037_07370 [Shewanella psychropiezotolerans]
MVKFNFFPVGAVFSFVVFYSLAIDVILNGDLLFVPELFQSYGASVGMMFLGIVITCYCISIFFRYDFFKVVMNKAYPNINLTWGKYRFMPPTVLFGLFLSGYIPYFTIPMMSFVIIELFYLFLVFNLSNNKEL